ncbi:MAG TPA: exodeoxyribonuclease VII large subunit, partial [Patescibacteria group bacterium]|nr:exodeoxyribonuclease VII large subunit [Patescibacteria group bacterium]
VLSSLSPLSVMDRGYSICQDAATGAVITDVSKVSVGDQILVRLSRGSLEASVLGKRRRTGGDGGAGGAGGIDARDVSDPIDRSHPSDRSHRSDKETR